MDKNSYTKNNSPQRQVKLPFLKSVEISVKSIRVRFFRSLITTISLVLAIFFYTYVNINSAIVRGIALSNETTAVQQLERQGYDLSLDGTFAGITPKERWILFLSLLVCVVGIVNTQLMAVTERFREIGTMKCLGALDRFILRLFLIEAGLQGLLGSAMGAGTGAVIAFFAGFIRFGTSAAAFVNWQDIALILVSAAGLGCFLSLLGVMYPAIVAAKMQPVETMRGKD